MSANALFEIVAELRRLAAWSPTTDEELARWTEQVQGMHELLRKMGDGIEVDERYWHTMIDADIRARDARYREIQQEGFLALIDEWEQRAMRSRAEHE